MPLRDSFSRLRQAGLFTGLIIVLMLGICTAGQVLAASQGGLAKPVGIKFKTFRQAQSRIIPAWGSSGTLWISLQAAVEYLGGNTTWHAVTHKAVVKGPAGRRVVITLGYPKAVVERNRFVRLPHCPRMQKGRILVSAEALVVIWKQMDNRIPVYDPSARTFKIEKLSASRTGGDQKPKPSTQHSLVKGLVVVDAGHGGKDPGAVGPSKLKEKTVTLEVAKQLTYFLRQQGLKVIMTRTKDRYISLKERADIANRAQADLFVSIHANASRNRKACGSQVFIYNREASSRKAAETARLENQDANYLEIIKDDLRQSVHESASINAAGLVSQEYEKIGGLEVRRIERAP
ncbi:N-acetylmuramoyl-L-alanine amidase, partial [bacterium]|nr:N-acetylmuramoyl-L-alanine amidase [bacterium]